MPPALELFTWIMSGFIFLIKESISKKAKMSLSGLIVL